jgi:hypothetical protein
MVQNIQIFELSNYSCAIYGVWAIAWDDWVPTSSLAIAANTENKQNKHVRSEVQIQWFT